MPRQPQLQPGQQLLAVGLAAADADAILKALGHSGFPIDQASSADEALQTLASGAVNLAIFAYKDQAEAVAFVQAAKTADPLAEIVLVLAEGAQHAVPKAFELPLTRAVLADPQRTERVLRHALSVQNLRERNAALFRTLMQANSKLKDAQVELEIRRSENRMLNAALATYSEAEAVAANRQAAPSAPPLDLDRMVKDLQKLVEKLGEEFNRALDAMLFYSAQILHQSGGTQESAELSRWIEREVERQRQSYEAVIQQYYAESMTEN